MAYADRVANMRRVVIWYKESGHIYLEGLLLDDTLLASCYDRDFPSYLQFTQAASDETALDQLIDYLKDRPEFKDLSYRLLDEETGYYDPRDHVYYNRAWVKQATK